MTTLTLPARARAQLTCAGIRVERGGRTVLHDVEMKVSPGSRWGVVGENGRGKSTLLHVLAGLLAPDAGTVHRVGTLALAEQEMPAEDERTVGDFVDEHLADARAALRNLDTAAEALAAECPGAEQAYADALEAAQALDAWDADRRVDVALDGLGAVSDRARRLATLSVGQRYRIRLACLLGAEYDFLLLDEPTNHLDLAGLDYLTARLRAHPGGVVVVSHDRALLADVATTILDLDPTRDGRPAVHGGGYAGYREGREAELARWEEEYEQQRSEHHRLQQALSEAQNRQITGWRPGKGTGKHQRATRAGALVRSVHRRQDDLERHKVTAPVPPQRLSLPGLPARPGVVLLRAEEVTVDGRLHRAASLSVTSGDRLAVTGPNGAGKSTLLSVLAGRLSPGTGRVHRARGVRLRLLGQESPRAAHRRARDLYEAHTAQLVTAGVLKEGEVVGLGSLGLLTSRDADKPVAELSVGQQRRLDLALAVAARPHVLLLDEPTNHLSIALVDELTEALRTTYAAVILATHDRQMQRDISTWPRLTLSRDRSTDTEGVAETVTR
ncbi:ABC-F family ATP-binding cassette domain-containing protein [Streptomyces lomondensis]|uniref:ABC transporter ATPase n=1 Tax=Streptomyces lomondensis TaxID=68229 RepID=A0ABQ2X241_9ACTN|nr:ABC-F family ATP-binding cassette domain-containing protein [Streptomyces lomondensis]MCF0082276.1 ATP-binding cassette domain-containing protein [Streptomyces lomondensis]GGW93633.1 ABC transporter ATPase [Streptomyces lomondensis]